MLEQLRLAMQPYGVDVLQLGFATPPRPPESVKAAIEYVVNGQGVKMACFPVY